MCEISIIVPVYNKQTYIENTVGSILEQTFHDFELLLIDDGSTDDSGRICDELAASDGRVKVFHTENHGVSAARNVGLRNAEGKYISFIDADDHVDKAFLEMLHASIENQGAALSVCGYYEIRNGIKTIHYLQSYGSGNDIYEILRQDLLCILWNKLFVREKIKHLFDESITTCEDSVFCSRYYLDNSPKIAYVNEILYGYMARGDGLTSVYQSGAIDGVNKLLKVNRQITDRITDERFRYLVLHHVYKVYFYGIYTYIFENLSKHPISDESLSVISGIINEEKYRRIIKYILKNSRRGSGVERNGISEYLVIFFSLLKMKKAIFYLSKVKTCLIRITNR